MHRDSNQRYVTVVTPVVTYGSLKTYTKPSRDEFKEQMPVCPGKSGTKDPPGNFHPPLYLKKVTAAYAGKKETQLQQTTKIQIIWYWYKEGIHPKDDSSQSHTKMSV
jgi:hypothetical protein